MLFNGLNSSGNTDFGQTGTAIESIFSDSFHPSGDNRILTAGNEHIILDDGIELKAGSII